MRSSRNHLAALAAAAVVLLGLGAPAATAQAFTPFVTDFPTSAQGTEYVPFVTDFGTAPRPAGEVVVINPKPSPAAVTSAGRSWADVGLGSAFGLAFAAALAGAVAGIRRVRAQHAGRRRLTSAGAVE